MAHLLNLQEGGAKIDVSLYRTIYEFIRDGDSILNMGCGSQFVFEKDLNKHKSVSITGIDIHMPKDIPECVDRFLCKSVEEELILESQFDVVTFFELIEHINNTDILLKNCYNNLRNGGYLLCSFPNLASLYSRLELLLGYQPHILEVSNNYANFGTGIFGKLNNPTAAPVNHIRGICTRAMAEMVKYHGFRLLKIIGYDHHFKNIFRNLPSISSVNIFICKK